MTAKQDLIAAALTAADELDELHKEGRNPATFTPSALREACARAMVQPDVSDVERLLRGEFICQKCGLRKDGEHDGKPDF